MSGRDGESTNKVRIGGLESRREDSSDVGSTPPDFRSPVSPLGPTRDEPRVDEN